MAIAAGRTTTVSSATTSDWVKLKAGTNRIYVSCATWSTTSVSMQVSNDASTAYPCENSSGQIVCTANKCFDVDGPGYIRLNCTAYAANAVTLNVTNPIDDRL
jgi:hypothetical protein